jgi:Leucine-rich repeat (LRR) protein
VRGVQHVNKISLQHNNLATSNNDRDPLPTYYLSNLTYLLDLNLKENRIGGNISDICYLSPTIETLDLKANRIGGALNGGCPDKTTFSSMLQLDLSLNLIHGTIDFICELESISVMDLSSNNFTSSIPSCIGNLTQMTRLYVDTNNLQGTIPRQLCTILHTLTELQLTLNQLSGKLPECFGELPTSSRHHPDTVESQLILLDFGANSLTGTIPASFGLLSNMKTLLFNKNKFSGRIGPICDIKNLNILQIAENKFTGTLACLNATRELTVIQAYQNKFNGSLDLFLCGSHKLYEVSLSQNSFSGSIPTCIGSLPQLQSIGIGDNTLTGSLPDSICEMSGLGKEHCF